MQRRIAESFVGEQFLASFVLLIALYDISMLLDASRAGWKCWLLVSVIPRKVKDLLRYQ